MWWNPMCVAFKSFTVMLKQYMCDYNTCLTTDICLMQSSIIYM